MTFDKKGVEILAAQALNAGEKVAKMTRAVVVSEVAGAREESLMGDTRIASEKKRELKSETVREKAGRAGTAAGKPGRLGTKAAAGKPGRSKGKTAQAVNEDVEQALLRKAVGYTYTQQESYKVKYIEYEEATGKKKFESESVEVVEVEKYVPPEYSAIALWLKARMPDVWGDAAKEMLSEPVVIVDDIPAQMGAGDGTAGGIELAQEAE